MIRRAGRAIGLGRARGSPVMWARHKCPVCGERHADGPDLCKNCQKDKAQKIENARKRALSRDADGWPAPSVSVLFEGDAEIRT